MTTYGKLSHVVLPNLWWLVISGVCVCVFVGGVCGCVCGVCVGVVCVCVWVSGCVWCVCVGGVWEKKRKKGQTEKKKRTETEKKL